MHQTEINCQTISIHAPAKGATSCFPRLLWWHNISIHAPAKGATSPQSWQMMYLWMISIHAPAKGATVSCASFDTCIIQFQSTLPRRERRIHKSIISASYFHFNPRSREGSDCLSHFPFELFCLFQSTLPRRERRT